MTDHSEAINIQYGRENLSTRILNCLKEAGKDTNNLTREDISPFEEFHIGGRGETINLARLAELRKVEVLLDVGCGIGGPARTLADEFGLSVTGLDLTEEYCQAGEMLTEKVGLSDLVDFQHGSALDMPFENESFDVVWTQHVTMNIEDKVRLYSEISRVLRPDGRYVFHEIMAGNGEQLHFPVFWSDRLGLSFLETPAEIRRMLSDCGLEEFRWLDCTKRALEWFENMLTMIEKDGPPPLGLNVIVGDNVPTKAANVSRNLNEGRIIVAQGCFCKTTG